MIKQLISTAVLLLIQGACLADDVGGVETGAGNGSPKETGVQEPKDLQKNRKAQDKPEPNKKVQKNEVEDKDTLSNDAQATSLENTVRGNVMVNNPVNTNLRPATSAIESQQIFGLNPYSNLEPGRLRLGQISFIPTVDVGLGYNDNINLSPTSKASSLETVISPKLVSYVDKGAYKYSLIYAGNFYRYPSSTIDNRNVNNIQFVANNGFTLRSNLTWSLGYTQGAEERGFNDDSRTQSLVAPNEFKYFVGNLNYIYGAQGAKGNIGFNMGYGNKEYTNNRVTTAGNDFETFNFGPSFTYRLAPKTFVTFAVNQTLTDYKLATPNQDYTDTKYSANIKWDATAVTQFYLTGGREFRSYDDANQNDRSLNFYQVGAYWSPYTYSTLELYTGRGLINGTTTSISDGISEAIGLNWRHKWREYISSNVSLSHTRVDYIGTASRVDNINNQRLSMSYQLSKNKELSVNYNHIKRNSTDPSFAYDQNVLLLGMSFSL
jgi:polysaccharide biosynthesis protein VpsM